MPEKPAEEEMQKVLFMNLVILLSSTAMQQLGKIVNPLTNKTQVDLQGAQATIDMLTMLEKKTKGNLDDDEGKLLTQTLSSLQMNYVETAASAGSEQAASTEDTDKKESEPTPASDKEPKDDKKTEKKDPKYHKSYE
jgi:hypothetical protein